VEVGTEILFPPPAKFSTEVDRKVV